MQDLRKHAQVLHTVVLGEHASPPLQGGDAVQVRARVLARNVLVTVRAQRAPLLTRCCSPRVEAAWFHVPGNGDGWVEMNVTCLVPRHVTFPTTSPW